MLRIFKVYEFVRIVLFAAALLLLVLSVSRVGHAAPTTSSLAGKLDSACDVSVVPVTVASTTGACVTSNGLVTPSASLLAAATPANSTALVAIDADGSCYYVDNPSAKSLFVPFRSATEWNHFISASGSLGVSLALCVRPETVSVPSNADGDKSCGGPSPSTLSVSVPMAGRIGNTQMVNAVTNGGPLGSFTCSSYCAASGSPCSAVSWTRNLDSATFTGSVVGGVTKWVLSNATYSGTPPASNVILAATSSSHPTAGNNITAYSGDTVSLTWTTVAAASCTADGDWSGSKSIPTGSENVVVSFSGAKTSYTYRLTCTDLAGVVLPTAVVTVSQVAPVTVSLVGTSNSQPTPGTTVTAHSGDTVNLTWTATNAVSCTASGDWSGGKNPAGGSESYTVPAAATTQTYSISCKDSNGVTSPVSTVTVNVTQSPTITLTGTSPQTATPSTVVTANEGDTVFLQWTTANTATCTATGDWSGPFGPASGSTSFVTATGHPTYTFSASCTNVSGEVSSVATVTVNVIASTPTVTLTGTSSLTASPSTSVAAANGGTVTLAWSSVNTASCTASGNWSGGQPVSGSYVFSVPMSGGSYTFTLVCKNALGTASAPSTVVVNSSCVTPKMGEVSTGWWGMPFGKGPATPYWNNLRSQVNSHLSGSDWLSWCDPNMVAAAKWFEGKSGTGRWSNNGECAETGTTAVFGNVTAHCMLELEFSEKKGYVTLGLSVN